MKEKDKVTIKYPKEKKQVPRNFVAAGTARGNKIKSVQGKIDNLASGKTIKGKTVVFITSKPRGEKYRWMVLFRVPNGDEGDYKLTVVGLDAAQGEVQNSGDEVKKLTVDARNIVQIGYPEEGHQIDADEKAFFIAYGAEDVPILYSTVGEQSADYIYDDPSIQFWCAQFPPLTSTGPQQLLITDSADSSDTINVTIL